VILTLVVLVFGFFTLAVAFGVTLTLNEHLPAFKPFTVVPLTEQTFLELAATTSTTLAPLATVIFEFFLMVAKEIVFPRLTFEIWIAEIGAAGDRKPGQAPRCQHAIYRRGHGQRGEGEGGVRAQRAAAWAATIGL